MVITQLLPMDAYVLVVQSDTLVVLADGRKDRARPLRALMVWKCFSPWISIRAARTSRSNWIASVNPLAECNSLARDSMGDRSTNLSLAFGKDSLLG